MGDFNAQIGTPNKYENVTGKFGFGKRNMRGERLIQFAHEYNLKIINTMFKLKPNRRWTWISPDKNTRNEIDFIMSTTPQLFKKYEVVSALPFGSDHRMLRAALHLKSMKKSRRKFSTPSSSLSSLKEQETYIENLSSYIPELLNSQENCNSDQYCQKIIHAISESVKSSKRNKSHKILSEKALKLMKERTELQNESNLNKTKKARLKALYKITNKEIRRCYEIHRMSTIQKHLDKSRSTKKAYKELNSSKKWIPSLRLGSTKTSSRTNLLNIATNFYTELYSQPDPSSPPTDQNYVCLRKDSSEIQKFTEPEILKQITKLKSEKSPGPDGITNECIKYAKTLLLTPITILLNKILIDETVPHLWTESEIILLYKKGDPEDIGNYRPISLIPCLYKLFASCLLDRICPNIDAHQPIEQAGFRSGFSTADHIQVVDLVIEKYSEFRKPLYLAFIDYKKAFDSIAHNSIWEALRTQDVKAKYINILRNIYTNSTSRVKLDRTGTTININRGVRQGDPISPKLFIAVLQHIMKNLPWSHLGINIKGEYLSHLRFADDIILFSESPHQLHQMINDLHQASIKIGLEMNLDKTKILTNHDKTSILVNNTPIEYVEMYVYLGKQISFKKERNIEEVERRVALTWKKYWAHKEIMKSNTIPLTSKKIIMDSEILPCLTYGCQTWTYDLKTQTKIQTTQRKMERSCLNIKLKDRVQNKVIRKKTKVTDALTFSLQRKWKWAGHVARYSDNRWTLKSVAWTGPKGTRARGRPRARWADEIEAIAGKKWLDVAKSRETWISLEEAFTRRGSIQDY